MTTNSLRTGSDQKVLMQLNNAKSTTRHREREYGLLAEDEPLVSRLIRREILAQGSRCDRIVLTTSAYKSHTRGLEKDPTVHSSSSQTNMRKKKKKNTKLFQKRNQTANQSLFKKLGIPKHTQSLSFTHTQTSTLLCYSSHRRTPKPSYILLLLCFFTACSAHC